MQHDDGVKPKLGSDISKTHFPANCECTDFIDHGSQAQQGIHVFPGKLYVLTMLENPLRWRARYRNYWAFEKYIRDSGAILYTAEIAFGERHFEITDPSNPRHLQLRAEQEPWHYEIWHKEGALNLLLNRLPADAKYVAWLDSDIYFARPDWAQETMHLLQQYQFIQMFSHAQDLGPNHEPINQTYGMVYHRNQDPSFTVSDYYYYGRRKAGLWVHPGFCWAARRDALNHVGGLIDWAVLGSGDWLMGAALFGEVDRALGGKSAKHSYHQTYRRWAHIWQERANRYIRQNVGFMPGIVYHRWHGRKIDRNYDTRWKLLVEQQFNPEIDLKRDIQGLYVLTESKELRDGLRKYASLRNEDLNVTHL